MYVTWCKKELDGGGGGWGEVGNFHTQSDPATGGRGEGEGIILIFTEAILLRQILIPNHLSASIT